MIGIDNEFETVWGWRTCEISEMWQKHNENEAQKFEAGYPQKDSCHRNLRPSNHLTSE